MDDFTVTALVPSSSGQASRATNAMLVGRSQDKKEAETPAALQPINEDTANEVVTGHEAHSAGTSRDGRDSGGELVGRWPVYHFVLLATCAHAVTSAPPSRCDQAFVGVRR
jgi:hypothetical protein